jgi:hypothetical protein
MISELVKTAIAAVVAVTPLLLFLVSRWSRSSRSKEILQLIDECLKPSAATGESQLTRFLNESREQLVFEHVYGVPADGPLRRAIMELVEKTPRGRGGRVAQLRRLRSARNYLSVAPDGALRLTTPTAALVLLAVAAAASLFIVFGVASAILEAGDADYFRPQVVGVPTATLRVSFVLVAYFLWTGLGLWFCSHQARLVLSCWETKREIEALGGAASAARPTADSTGETPSVTGIT